MSNHLATPHTPSISRTASDRVRQRLRDELQARRISQRDLADALSRTTPDFWTQSKVQKILAGDVELKVDDVDAIANVVGIFLSEAVRDRGLEFYAEMTPAELRVLQRLRQKPHALRGLMILLDVTVPNPIISNLSRALEIHNLTDGVSRQH